MKRGTLLGLITLAAAAAVLLLPRFLERRQATPPPAAAADAATPALPVEVLEVLPRRITEELATTGTLRANEQIDLVSEITGVVETIHFEEGVPVEAGDLLVTINDDELQARRERVRYQLELAEMRERRQLELREEGVISQQEYDLASSELGVLRAEEKLVETQLEKTEIRAPFAGRVGLRYVSRGSLLSPQMRITTLQDVDPVKMDFTLPEAYADRVRPGTEVAFRVKGIDRTFHAEVYAIEPRVDPETRSLRIRGRSPNPDGRLLPGAFADVTLAVNRVDDALAVPSLAVIPELGGKKVFVLEDGLAQPRRVETGIRTDTEVQIVAGLAAGDRVIVSAIQRLRPGLPVTAIADAS
ncbi:MAG: efflux RND transporter periplasmic adaptor subunit [Acidobacteriota bacterium]|jgi:membrane fusion protein (multidrug efflux system)